MTDKGHFYIESASNPKIKDLLKLKTAKTRKEKSLIVIEGYREVSLALSAGFEIKALFYCSDHAGGKTIPSGLDKAEIFHVSAQAFNKISGREHPDGFIAVAAPKRSGLNDIPLKPDPLIIILEAVEKPGNLGAILRTADAAGADAVLIADPQTDIYNPNVIRASQGTVFTVPSVVSTSAEIIAWLADKRIEPFATTPDAEDEYTQCDFTGPSAIILGTEADGLTESWLDASRKIRIPMRGRIDSLNVSAAAAIVVFEALRQRSNALRAR